MADFLVFFVVRWRPSPGAMGVPAWSRAHGGSKTPRTLPKNTSAPLNLRSWGTRKALWLRCFRLWSRIGCSISAPSGRSRSGAKSWSRKRRVVTKVEWHPGELCLRVGFIVTNLSCPAERVVAFYNQRGTAEQHIKEGKTR